MSNQTRSAGSEQGGAVEESRHREGDWAAPVSKLKVTADTEGAINLNVDGRQVTKPLQGFGQLWQKTYQVRLQNAQVSPQKVIQIWKYHFPEF